MIKRLPIIAAVFFLLTVFINPALAGTPYNETAAIEDALQNYNGYYKPFSQEVPGQDQGLHYITTTGLSNLTDANGNSYGFLTYGQPHGDQKDGQSRYIGYTYYGEDYTNMDFPADKNAGGADFTSQNWIYQPWDNPDVKANNPNIKKFDTEGLPSDGDPAYHTAILAGIMAYGGTNANNGYTISEASNPAFWNEIEKYVHILSPAAAYSFGIGRMWHYDSDGYPWYVTVPIMPNALLPELGNLKAVSIDLGVPPGQKAEPGAEYTATVVFENESAETMLGTPVAVLHGQFHATLYDENGQILPKKVVGGKEVHVADFDKKGAPGAKRTFTCKWRPFVQSEDGLTGIVNHNDIGRVHDEKTYDDNKVSAKVNVKLLVNLIALRMHPGLQGQAEPGAAYTATVDFKNDSENPLYGVPVGGFNREYRAVLKDASGNAVEYTDFAPGEIKSFYFTYHAPDSGATRISGVIDTPPLENRFAEISEDDNTISYNITVREAVQPVHSDPRLHLQAYSKAGEDVYGNWCSSVAREPYTARWTDDVKATLTINRPNPPRGTLDWWEISYADITYPKKNPDFQFGDPLPPVGTVTKSLNVPGRGLEGQKQAAVTFEEDWGMDGAQIYNGMRGELMAEYPKNYPISVNFKVTYQYTYTVCHCDEDGCTCWSVTETGSYTDTATASLLVNGTGVGSYAS